MNIFLLLGGFLFVGIIAAILICFLGLIITACVKKSRKLALWSVLGTAGVIVAVTGVFCAIAYLWFRPYDPTSRTELQNAYRADFGTLPPVGITVLKSRQVVIVDSGIQWLLLGATPEAIDRHIAMGFQRVATTPSDFVDAGANAPKWWQPPTARLEFYENTNWSKAGGWYSSRAAIGIDRASNMIWFAASKSD
jgi:hypothetical protein